MCTATLSLMPVLLPRRNVYQAWQDTEHGRQKFTRDGVETTIEKLGQDGVSASLCAVLASAIVSSMLLSIPACPNLPSGQWPAAHVFQQWPRSGGRAGLVLEFNIS
jgi:hypothetical protein